MANLGDVGKLKGLSPHALALSTPVGTNGDAGMLRTPPRRYMGWNWYTVPSTRSNAFTIPTTRMVTLTLNGRFIDAAQGAAGAKFYDVQDGTFYAHEADGNGMWQVSIVGGVPTVTQVTHGYGIGQGQRPVVVASGDLQVLAPGDFLLGVAMNFPYQLSGGSLQQMALSSANTLPLILTNGTNTTLQVTLNG